MQDLLPFVSYLVEIKTDFFKKTLHLFHVQVTTTLLFYVLEIH